LPVADPALRVVIDEIMYRSSWGFAFATVALAAACGGSQKEAEEPKAEPQVAASPEKAEPEEHAESKPADDAKASDDSTKKDDSSDKKEASASESKSIRSAKDIITREDVFFEFSFVDSELHDVSDKQCTAKAKDDPKKKADCMSKAQDQVEVNGVALRKDQEGNWLWYAIRRNGPKMVPLHKFEVDFSDDSDHSVTVVPKGRDQGTKAGRTPSKIVVEVPTDSQIVLTDPKLGKMAYIAKLGLFGKNYR
jgi:hypothetical protein